MKYAMAVALVLIGVWGLFHEYYILTAFMSVLAWGFFSAKLPPST